MENSFTLTRRKALGLGATALAMPFLAKPAFAETSPVLVELFTSQGCSSCPAADQFAGKLMNRPNIMMVSLNVDYWDYLGWKDTLAQPAYTKRQMDYAHARGDMDVYTPQMVINGSTHAVGSNQDAVAAAIASARSKSPAMTLVVEAFTKNLKVSLPKSISGDATLWAMSIARKVDVKIQRGENSGKVITYNNVVQKLAKLATWSASDTQLIFPRNPNVENGLLILQSGTVGPVLAMGKIS
jgi:hypothetical protein